ncbi:hypothetical protein GCM10027445_16670 [Amycolatopsis endophytica]|uniref:Membrane-bound lytic murein transglycosylase B n=1 Tax=Amycolatopsis endophytica TaxID=860233 RepID=A0A853B542_9PSEU|nr:hypothetical protein [Amycolatopsis endophytica]NYI90120.1 hypothetical protein [Amycolatopsis endophytica]
MMLRQERWAAERRRRKSEARRVKLGAYAAASLALVPFLPSGGVPIALVAETGATGESAQASLSPAVLDAADDPLMLAAQLPSFADLPITPMGAPVTSAPRIPASVWDAYHRAAAEMARIAPDCHLDWSLLAAIGRIESGHARGGRVDADGTTTGAILGPVLDGGAFAAIRDTDGGALDGDVHWDRAVGPMQFIPATFRSFGADGNGDGVVSPHNIFDAALAAGRYLCAGGGDLRDPRQRAQAVFRYNHSDAYVATVLLWADAYARGGTPVADSPGVAGPVVGAVVPGAVAPGAPVVSLPGAPVAVPPPPPVTVPAPPSVTPPATPPPSPTRTLVPTTTSTTSEPPSSSCTPAPTTTSTPTTTTPVETTTPPVETTSSSAPSTTPSPSEPAC